MEAQTKSEIRNPKSAIGLAEAESRRARLSIRPNGTGKRWQLILDSKSVKNRITGLESLQGGTVIAELDSQDNIRKAMEMAIWSSCRLEPPGYTPAEKKPRGGAKRQDTAS